VAELTEQPSECRGLVVRIEAAGIGKQPYKRIADLVRLKANDRFRSSECCSIGRDAEYRERARLLPADDAHEAFLARDEIFLRKLRGRGGRARDEVGDPEPKGKKVFRFTRSEQPRRETAGVKRGPESVSRASEVMAGPCGVESRVDAAEEYAEVRRNYVGDGAVCRCEQLGPSRSPPHFFKFLARN